MTDPFIRFWQKIELTDEGCWFWTASKTASGYGYFWPGYPGPNAYAHKWIWELFNGRVPEGLELDHVCRVTSCVNPAHLELVTRRENLLRSPLVVFRKRSEQTHCKHGHSFETHGYRDSTGRRRCKICIWNSNHRRKAA